MIDLPYLDAQSRVVGTGDARAQVAGYLTTAENRLSAEESARDRVRRYPTSWVVDAGYRESRYRLAREVFGSARVLAGSVAEYCDDMATASRTIREFGDESGYALTDQLGSDADKIREEWNSLALGLRVTIAR